MAGTALCAPATAEPARQTESPSREPLTARKRFDCWYCGQRVEPGGRMWPVDVPAEGAAQAARRLYVHPSCAARANGGVLPAPPPCKHWLRRGACLFDSDGGRCFFSHPEHERGALALRPHNGSGRRGEARGGERQRRKVLKRGRAKLFRDFLVRVFGEDLMRLGGVLDVAGGKGELAFVLENLNGVRCDVIDPRRGALAKCRAQLKVGIYHQNPCLNATISRDFETCARGAAATPVRHRMILTRAVVHAVFPDGPPDPQRAAAAFRDAIAAADDPAWELVGDGHPGDPARAAPATPVSRRGGKAVYSRLAGKEVFVEDGDEEDDCGEVRGDVEARTAAAAASLRACSLVVGMHPDQATDPIVEAGLRGGGKAFCVVPCCVFARENDHRRLPDGRPVSTHDELIRYLAGLDPGIVVEELPIGGQNIAVCYAPPGMRHLLPQDSPLRRAQVA
ncbi:unnamed protein product [Pedinophyceae sp. YPF-701]|nr:unnamed protein product [Pedinophyceae sp. YPF-701]